MKVFFFYFSLLILSFSSAFYAQKITFSANSDFSFSGPNSLSGVQNKVIYENDLSISTLRGSLGAGKALELTSYLTPYKNFSMGLSYHYLKGTTITSSYMETSTSSFQVSMYAIQTRLQAFFMFSVPVEKINFLMKAGLLIPVKTQSFQELDDRYSDGMNKVYREERYTYNFSFGYFSSLGFEVKVWKGLHIQAFMSSYLSSLTLKNRKTAKYVLNDEDRTATLSAYEANSIYFEDINNFSNNSGTNGAFVTTKAKDELTSQHNFNSLGLTIGLSYQLSRKK